MPRRSNRFSFVSLLPLPLLLLGSTPTLALEPIGFAPELRWSMEHESSVRLAEDGTRGRSAGDGRKFLSVIVDLEDAPLASYRGGIAGLAPTARQTSNAKIDVAAPAARAYLDYMDRRIDSFEALVVAAIPGARTVHRYRAVVGGVSMLVPAGDLARLRGLPGVKAVYHDRLEQLTTESSPEFIGAPRVWDELGGQDAAGEGIIVGVLDSGIWPEHPSFSDPDPSGNPYPSPPGPSRMCEFGSPVPGDSTFQCNNKLIGARRFLQTYELLQTLLSTEFLSARDDCGHGTHTSTTAAGNGGVDASLLGTDRGTVSGIAPRAHVIAYKVCGVNGCFQSDSTAAIEQAILDGVDVINFSVSGGTTPYEESTELAFLDAYDAGVFVAASAGNSGPGPDTASHLGPWTTTVGASTTDRQFLSTITLTADGGDTAQFAGASITEGYGPAPVEQAGGDGLCDSGMPSVTAGAIVLCDRGAIARVTKSFNVSEAGGGGMILVNTTPNDLSTDNHFIPSVHVDDAARTGILDFLGSHTGVMGTFTAGTATSVPGDVMAAFSSRGGPGQTLGISKPDVTAPGVQILAGNSPLPAVDGSAGGSVPGELFQAIQGTSMSSPHIAGSAALVTALHPNWTPAEVASALMTTATTDVLKEDAATAADPFDMGAGRVDLNVAGDPGVSFDNTAQDMVDLQDQLWNLNYPSLYVPAHPGRLRVERTIHNETDGPLDVKLRWRQMGTSGFIPQDERLRVRRIPKTLSLGAGEDGSFVLDINARNLADGQIAAGILNMRMPGHGRQHMPITVVRGQNDLTIDKSCSPTGFGTGQVSDCVITIENNGFENAAVNMTDKVRGNISLVPGSVVGGIEDGDFVSFPGTVPGGTPAQVTVETGISPAGYEPLSGFGVAPFPPLPDDFGFSLNMPPFVFNGETFDTIAVFTNGFLVPGGNPGSGFAIAPNQTFPDPTAPNNVIAPFWTDLNLEAGGAMRAEALTDGVNSYVIFDWENAPNASNGQTNSFQIWIGIDGVQDITFTYGNVSSGSDGMVTIGAENQFGTSGDNFFVDGVGTLPSFGDELRVSSTAPTTGGIRTISYQIEGGSPGEWRNCARMTSNLFDGKAIDCDHGLIQ